MILKGHINMKFSRLGMIAVLGALVLAGCETQPGFNGQGGGLGGLGTKQTIGAGAGAVLGGVAGSNIGKGKGQLVGTGVGVLLGALLGSEVGKSLDKADMAYAQQAQARAYSAPVGQSITWNNPQSGNSGTFTPVRDGYKSSGEYCREYTQVIKVGGETKQGVGTACRNPDGSWQVIN